MKILIILICGLIISCNIPTGPKEDWEIAPRVYKCSKEQMDKVEHESKFCDDNTTYVQTYCYGTAIIRNCTKRQN